jgi:vanadium-dependent haloperoxidase-like protein
VRETRSYFERLQSLSFGIEGTNPEASAEFLSIEQRICWQFMIRADNHSALPLMKKLSLLFLCLLTSAITAAPVKGPRDAFGPYFQGERTQPAHPGPAHRNDVVHRWNRIAIDATGLDHTPVAAGDPRIFGEQLGPGRASRAMAIVHIAIFDAINAVQDRYNSYTNVRANHRPVSLDAAIAQAARDTLVALYPSQSATFNDQLARDLLGVRNRQERLNGIELGHRVAAALLAMRANDGAEIAEPTVGVDYFTSNLVGHWRQDPVSLIPLALGAHWGECRPFVVQSGHPFRTPAPPALTSSEYTVAYNEAKNFGGDGIHTPTQRTAEQTFIGTFWAYDGTPSLCAPPRLYNQIAVQIADQRGLDPMQLARVLALVNVAMADAAMAAWDSKFHWDVWRPITAIRESDPGSGPTGEGDGNPATVGDPTFMPLGAPASNLVGPNFTPPFPTYPSGHATIGGSLFQTLRRFYGTDRIGFTFVSDEFNGVTIDNNGNVRPYMPRSFSKLSQAEDENGQSRIYLGIHWRFDKTEGIRLGESVGNYVFDHVFRPLH